MWIWQKITSAFGSARPQRWAWVKYFGFISVFAPATETGRYKQTTSTLGQQGEDLAVRHLRHKGYRILDRNVVLGKYEIDIIAATRDTTIFVEVRTRESADPVRPEDSIGPKKRAHIRKAAKRYIACENNPNRYYRYDIIAIVYPPNAKPQIEHFENAFGEHER